MLDQGEAGAMAAAGHFMRLFSYVFQTGDVSEWDQISAQECEFCANVRTDVVTVYESGGSYVGGDIAVGAVEAIGYDDVLRVHAVTVVFDFAAMEKVDRWGSTVETLPAETGLARLELVYSATGWMLLGGNDADEASA